MGAPPNERCLKLTVAYVGSGYAGFQLQAGQSTIQGELERAIYEITGSAVRVAGAGRTDAGVHARGQAVSFQVEHHLPVERWPYAMNGHLPRDIVVRAVDEMENSFHACKSARSKTYTYTVLVSPHPCPVRRPFVLHHPRSLDVEAMAKGAGYLVGTIDFASFRSAGGKDRGTIRTVQGFTVSEEKDQVVFRVRADGFLYRMVRNMVGTLLAVGRGDPPERVLGILEGRNRQLAGPTAPPQGLFLEEVEY